MTKGEFINRIRGIYNIDGSKVEDALSPAEQSAFLRDPPRFLMGATAAQSDAIWREVEARQPKRFVMEAETGSLGSTGSPIGSTGSLKAKPHG